MTGMRMGEGMVAQLELVLGDLFDSDADILVVPCNTSGGMTGRVEVGVRKFGATVGSMSAARFEPGQVSRGDSAQNGRTILFAATVPSIGKTTADIVTRAAREVGRFASRGGVKTALPLLGTGAGGLSPATALGAIATGFRSSAHPDALAELYVLHREVYEPLRRQLLGRPTRPATMPDSDFSPTVEAVRSELEAQGAVPAAVVVNSILTRHSEYAGHTSESIQLEPDNDASRRSVFDWLNDVRQLFDAEHVQTISGRLVIIGLCLLDPDLRWALDRGGFLDRLISELREPLTKMMTPEAADLYAASAVTPTRDDNVPTHTDNPALVDELGRKGFARILARRIRDARDEEAGNSAKLKDPRKRRGGAFLAHLHAPWGAGKTSMLNFLAKELQDGRDEGPPWVVVKFNAWRHQRVAPPWWWLMTTLYREAAHELDRLDRRRAVMLRVREWYWRLKGGWPGYVAILLVVAILVLAWRMDLLDRLGDEDLLSLQAVSGLLLAVGAILTPVITIWGLMRGLGRWVFATSARGARRFIDSTTDPMRTVHEHLLDLVYWVRYDIVVMIDDLDRCKSPYVVELLEGIQTLFRDVPVTYVIAADRDWLSDSYTAEYGTFTGATADPGRPIGYLFLEKTFQISAGLPPAGDRVATFWNRILHSPKAPDEEEIKLARDKVKADLAGKADAEARREVAHNRGASAAEEQARLEAVAVQMVSVRAQQEHAHTLAPFRTLLGRDPNPRAMKRLVNAYGIARGIETLDGFNLEADHLREQETALWTILNMRWPRLGAHLARYPEFVAAIGGSNSPQDIPEELVPLTHDQDVIAVVRGDAAGVTARLNEQNLRMMVLR